MKKDNFTKMTFGSITILVVLVGIFIFLNNFTKPHVNDIQIQGEKTAADFSNQKLRFDFNRPIKKTDVTNLATAKPSSKFQAIWSGNSLFIIFNETLSTSTNYKVELNKDNIEDIYGVKPEANIVYEFQTKKQRLAYIERVNGQNDKIVIADVDFSNKETLYETPKIKFFGINSDYLVVVTEPSKASDIVVVNRKTQEGYSLGFKNVLIESFDLSPTKNEFTYTKQDIEILNNYYVPKSSTSVQIYNLDNKEDKTFNPQNSATNVIEVKYSKDGNSLLYKSADSFFNLSEIDNSDNVISIGRYMAKGNFNFDSSKIIFLNYDPLLTYLKYQFIVTFDSSRNIKQLTDGTKSVLDPLYLNKSDKILYSELYKDLEGTKGIFNVSLIDEDGNKTVIVKDENNSLELPKPSPDDRYIVMEKYNQTELEDYTSSRNFGFQNKPYTGSLIVYDSKDGTIIDKSIRGISAYWLTN